ncbi:hypothetical protein [Paenibacillus sophorae]|uniref:Uncharacterized protein n=1 Tax=Paenibacillus sophorae TaxID=1333845 RepID=A0ABX8H8G5_9BACL|nr:hypothetical protein [Paenibacillus sophorae]QWU14545.1 hypothetical protein KP014_21830 [Paenibacillus sophorae]
MYIETEHTFEAAEHLREKFAREERKQCLAEQAEPPRGGSACHWIRFTVLRPLTVPFEQR